MSNKQFSPPKLAMLLIKLFTPSRVVDNLIGDLYEEYSHQLIQNENDISKANKWFWQQSLQSTFRYSLYKLTSPEFLRYINVLVCVIGVFINLMLIIWLSYADSVNGYSDSFWSNLLQGKVHLALVEPQFWRNVPEYIKQIDKINFLLSPSSFVIALVATGVLAYLYKTKASVFCLMISGGVIVFLPYIWSLLFLGSHSYQPTQVGPVIAIGLLSALYILPIVTYIMHLKFTEQIEKQVQLS